jgi:hypothetical protein
MFTIFWLGNMKGTHHSEDTGIDVRIIFEWMLKK